jgi:hypothetical protein
LMECCSCSECVTLLQVQVVKGSWRSRRVGRLRSSNVSPLHHLRLHLQPRLLLLWRAHLFYPQQGRWMRFWIGFQAWREREQRRCRNKHHINTASPLPSRFSWDPVLLRVSSSPHVVTAPRLLIYFASGTNDEKKPRTCITVIWEGGPQLRFIVSFQVLGVLESPLPQWRPQSLYPHRRCFSTQHRWQLMEATHLLQLVGQGSVVEKRETHK